MKLPKSTVIAIDTVLIIGGIAIVLAGITYGAAILLEAIGTGLIATGGVNLLNRTFSEKPEVDGVKMIASTRNALDAKVHDRKEKAQKVEMLGISLSSFLREIANDPKQLMANRVLRENMRLRVIFVHPDAQYLYQRAIEDNRSHVSELQLLQKKSVEYCVQFYTQLMDRYQVAIDHNEIGKPKGIVQVKLIDFCPYITIERYDGDVYWGLYTSDTAGEYAPMFLTTREDNYVLYDKLKNHFVGLLTKDFENNFSQEDHFLIRMESGAPWLNYELAEKVLGEDALKNLLGDTVVSPN